MISGFDILVFLFVLGVLIFVHELGHFLAAKACGIYVDRFSLGMPPRIFGFKYGDTDYCIGLLPIGGYVKMAGQEDAPLSDEERETTYGHVPPEQWYNTKPVWQRAIVLIAGPLMNLVLAFVIYAGMNVVGKEVQLASIDTRVGIVEEDSPASMAPLYPISREGEAIDASDTPASNGWKTGDKILSINGKEMTRFQDIFVEAILGADKVASVDLERTEPDGTVQLYRSRIEPLILDEEEKIARFGFAPFNTALIEYVLPNSPAQEGGLLAGDIVLSAQGEVVDSGSFSMMVSELEPDVVLDLEVLRGEETLSLSFSTRSEGRFQGISFSPTLRPFILLGEDARPQIAPNDSDFHTSSGLHEKDVLVAVNGNANIGAELRALYDAGSEDPIRVTLERTGGLFGLGEDSTESVEVSLEQVLQGLTGADPELPVEVFDISDEVAAETNLQRKDIILEIDGEVATAQNIRALEKMRPGETVSLKVKRPTIALGAVQSEEEFNTELRIASIQQIGVVWGTQTVFIKTPTAQILPEAARECYRVTVQIGATLSRLVTGALNPELLGGPVMIASVTTQAARVGIFPLLDTMAMISVNLCIFNLLPLPVLDGGQLTFLAIEAVRRKPVSTRIMEGVQQAGVLLILGLIVYVTFNDISRIFNSWLVP